jgi:PAS domain S-box-containing protein
VYRIFGFEPQKFGATYEAFLDAVHPEDRAAVDAAYSGSLREGRSSYEIEHRILRRQTGEVRWVHEKCEHIRDASGAITRSIGMVQDITERKRAEEQLRQAQKLESIGLLAGGIAHDFNNLLVGIIGNASLAEDMLPDGSPAVEILDRIVKCGEQAAHLTRQMLAYAGKGRFVLEPVDLSGLVRETAALITGSVSKKISIVFELVPDLPRVQSDPSQMQQVFMNLALNAAEAIGSAAGVISIATGEIILDDADVTDELQGWPVSPGHCVFLDVRDTGCGMDETTKARIFDPFFTTKFQGRGLGLAAVAGIVRAHKGAIQFSSTSGAGSAFRVLLPAMSARPAETAPAIEHKDDLRGLGTILVVDDEQVVRHVAKHSLERQGYEVIVAESGPAAIDILRNHRERVQLVLLDLSMPGMSGEETLPQLRNINPHVQIIVSSGHSEAEALRLFDGARVSGFIQKPYTVQALAHKVKSVLCQTRAATIF